MASSKRGFKQVLYWYKTEQPQSSCYRTRCAAAEPAIVAVMQSRVLTMIVRRVGMTWPDGMQCVALPILWRNYLDGCREGLMLLRIQWFDDRGLGGGITAEIVIPFPTFCRSDRTRGKPAAAVRTNVCQHGAYAATAEGTFKRADHRFGRIAGQRLRTVFAAGTKLKHALLPIRRVGRKPCKRRR
jgi:hypothetical protein